MPLSMAEMQADKDQLRAQFAMSMRRLEVNVEQLRDKTTSQLAELGKRSQTINRLELDLCEKTAATFALETHGRALRDQLCEAEEELAARTGILRELERTLADKEQQLAWITADRDEPQVTADDLARADRIVALKRDEHLPLLQERFPAWVEKVEFWQVDDAPEAVAVIEHEVMGLIARLVGGGSRSDVHAPATSTEPPRRASTEPAKKPVIPSRISSTTAGSRTLGKSPSPNGAANAAAATITRLVNETSFTGPL